MNLTNCDERNGAITVTIRILWRNATPGPLAANHVA
jgi:hypothetical protein